MNILEITTTVLTALLTIITSYILIKQYKLDQKKFQFEHFERRYFVYRKVMDYIAHVVKEGSTLPEEMMELK